MAGVLPGRSHGGLGVLFQTTSLALIVSLWMGGCAHGPVHRARKPSAAVAASMPSRLGRCIAPEIHAGAGKSGLALVVDGPEAYADRVAVADLAQHTLDLQYFIWNGDHAGSFLLDKVLKAADRGVRVRLLVDDAYSKGLVTGALQNVTSGVRTVLAEIEDGVSAAAPPLVRRRDRTRQLLRDMRTGGRDLVAAA